MKSVNTVRQIMLEFAHLTGLEPQQPRPRRYLWTDAFAVCNLLELHRVTQEPAHLEQAVRLVDQVHHVLGRHREDDPRNGWISGMTEEEGERHPTAGGLRIGKRFQERSREEPPDEWQEWERDGQYFHYLTKWMHALGRLAAATGKPRYLRWALELARGIHGRFTFVPREGESKALHWKMSIDLSYPQVPSMGQHDPVDGLVTYSELTADAARYPREDFPGLAAEIEEMHVICRGKGWETDDPLGIGGLLWDACRIAQLMNAGAIPDGGLLEKVLDSALVGLELFAQENLLKRPAYHRLAFRELGLSIGLKGVRPLHGWIGKNQELREMRPQLLARVEALSPYLSLADKIESFWLDPANHGESWSEHREINMVMLATSLAPESFLLV